MRKCILMVLGSLLFTVSVQADVNGMTEMYLNAILNPQTEADYSFIQPNSDFEVAAVRTLATRTVGPRLKLYSAGVANCARGLTHVRLLVTRAGVTVQGGGAKFSDGSSENVNFNQTFQAGYTSPWIDIDYLGANGRCVTSVYVNARSADAARNARVEVQGSFE